MTSPSSATSATPPVAFPPAAPTCIQCGSRVAAPSVFEAIDFGAIGDGSHDDTASLQAAVNAAGGRARGGMKGGVVHLSTGKYR
ncbi:MAG: hypothetical protein ACRENE_27965, partial [Polyangiaceae bacterium]